MFLRMFWPDGATRVKYVTLCTASFQKLKLCSYILNVPLAERETILHHDFCNRSMTSKCAFPVVKNNPTQGDVSFLRIQVKSFA